MVDVNLDLAHVNDVTLIVIVRRVSGQRDLFSGNMQKCCEVGGRIGGKWETNYQNWWEVGDWPQKQVRDGRLSPKTGGRWEFRTPATLPSPLFMNTEL